MAQKQVPLLVEKVLQLAQPTFVNGRWRKPALSGRKLAAVRRVLVMDGLWWRKPLRDRGAGKPLKLIRHEREREARQATIAENMRKMPDMVAEYRQKRRELREKTRASKKRTDQEMYLIATGKSLEGSGQSWEIFKDKKSKETFKDKDNKGKKGKK